MFTTNALPDDQRIINAVFTPTNNDNPTSAKPRKVRLNAHSGNADSVTVAWRERVPFNANGTLLGQPGAIYDTGRLPAEWREVYRAEARKHNVAFTVLSYATPIAWVLNDGTEVKPPVRYSVTTSKHQGRLY